ncbi:hypothetical protein [Shewanella baltica]|uniref:hypothetical protein n=1 Tax=Shewanella baltica TaxID=62322 RepID=UPI003CFD694B
MNRKLSKGSGPLKGLAEHHTKYTYELAQATSKVWTSFFLNTESVGDDFILKRDNDYEDSNSETNIFDDYDVKKPLLVIIPEKYK